MDIYSYVDSGVHREAGLEMDRALSAWFEQKDPQKDLQSLRRKEIRFKLASDSDKLVTPELYLN